MGVRIVKTENPRIRTTLWATAVDRQFTDHMLVVDYAPEKCWHEARIVPYGPLSIDPASVVLHYAQAVFECLKAFQNSRKGVILFRPDRYLARLNRSAARLCIPSLPEGFALDAIRELVGLEADWLRRTGAHSLDVLASIIATEPTLGLYPSRNYTFFAILSTAGPSQKEGLSPVSLLVEPDHVRAAKGGLGGVKTPANYAAGLLAAQAARAKGFAEVLWLDAIKHRFVEEVGTMNIFFRIGDELVTPDLDGSILGGIVRECVIHLAREWSICVIERPIGMEELVDAHARGILHEVFGSATPAVICPVSQLSYKGHRLVVNDGAVGGWTRRFYDAITGIQQGSIEDPYGWTTTVAARTAP